MPTKRRALFEAMPFKILEMNEVEENGQKRFRVKGIFNRADEKNSNNRIYPSSIVEREHKKLNERLAKHESVFMQADHPADGVSRIGDTTAMMRSVEFDPTSKLVTGEADIISTHKGKDLQEIIRAGGTIGISARGFGTTTPGECAGQKGDVVNEDYSLVTYDFVVGQSTRGAVVTNFAEQANELASQFEEEMDMDLKTLDLEAFKAARPDLITQIEAGVKAAAKTEAEAGITAKIAEATEKIETKIRAELKLEAKKGKKGADNAEEEDMEEMMQAAARLGFTLEATSPQDKQRYGGGKGRKGKGTENSDDSDAEDQEDTNGPNEQELVAFAKKHNLKLEKKGGNDNGVNEKVAKVEAELRDAKTVMTEATNRVKVLEEQNKATEIKSYIFEKVNGLAKHKNAVTERLLAAKLQTKDEVDKQLPIVQADIERLITEASGGGHASKQEPIGSENKKLTLKGGAVITEAQLRERELAGLPTELVEQAK